MPEAEDVPDDLDEALALRRGPGSRFALVCGLTPALFAGVCVCRRVVFFGFFSSLAILYSSPSRLLCVSHLPNTVHPAPWSVIPSRQHWNLLEADASGQDGRPEGKRLGRQMSRDDAGSAVPCLIAGIMVPIIQLLLWPVGCQANL